jgi:hypothetical protein
MPIEPFRHYKPGARRPKNVGFARWMLRRAQSYLLDQFVAAPKGSQQEIDVAMARLHLEDCEKKLRRGGKPYKPRFPFSRTASWINRGRKQQ